MSKIAVQGPHRNSGGAVTWTMVIPGVTFSVVFSRAPRDMDPIKGDWQADIEPVGIGQYGIGKRGAFNAVVVAVNASGKLPTVDWIAVATELTTRGAFT
jgi:hypothetical protein